MSRWFRVYDDLVDDPKIQRLSGEVVKSLLNLWCLASQNDGILPAADDIAFKLRMTPSKVAKLLSVLGECGLIDSDEDGLRPHNWNGRQYKSDEKAGTGKESYVYFIGKGWGSTLKIGFSKNPWARIAELQTAQPEKLSVLATFRCKSNSEVDLHDVLRDFRKSGEWFDLPTKIYVAVHDAADRSCPYDELVAELRSLLRSTTTETETETEQRQNRTDIPKPAAKPTVVRDPVFEELRKAYPRRKGSDPGPPAAKIFLAAIKAGTEAQIIIDGARRFAVEESQNINTPYIPQLVKWLRDKRWLDHTGNGMAQPRLDIRSSII